MMLNKPMFFQKNISSLAILHHFLPSLVTACNGKNIIFYLLAMATTLAFIGSGVDSYLRSWFLIHHPLGGYPLRWIYYYFGEICHIALGIAFFCYSFAKDDRSAMKAGAAVFQTLLTTFLIVTLLKLISGRPSPLSSNQAGEFHFGAFNFMESLTMWPSGHTATAFAIAVMLHRFYCRCRWLPYLLYPLALFIGLTMLDGKFHWTSDVAAGAIIAIPIGITIGSDFATWDRQESPDDFL